MVDFIDYFVKTCPKEKVYHASLPGDYLLVWTINNSSNLLGFSINSDIPWEAYQIKNGKKLEAIVDITERLAVPLIWIFQPLIREGKLELGIILKDVTGGLQCNKEQVPLSDCGHKIQSILGTDFAVSGASKTVNTGTHDPFHTWSRAALPINYIKNDVDLMVFGDDKTKLYYVEIKRSDPPERWMGPYRDDIPNYLLQKRISEKIGAVSILIQHDKRENVKNETKVRYSIIEKVDPSLTGNKFILGPTEFITAIEALRRLSKS